MATENTPIPTVTINLTRDTITDIEDALDYLIETSKFDVSRFITARAALRSRSTSRWLKVQDILADLEIHRRTWQRWRELGRTPRCKRLPNGELRIRRDWYEAWLEVLDEDVAA
jgi:hypothetical protein